MSPSAQPVPGSSGEGLSRPGGGLAVRACLVYVTCPDEAAAVRLARLLLAERLCACANVVPGLRSLYWWEGAVADEAEVLLIVKTLPELAEEAARRIRENHPYTVPAVLFLPVLGGNEDYLRWLAGECRPGGEPGSA